MPIMNSLMVRRLKKIMVFIIGGTVLLFGIILIFLPGPSFLVIPAGLAILAMEFSWARILLQRARNLSDSRLFSFLPWRRKPGAPDKPVSPGADRASQAGCGGWQNGQKKT